MTEPTSVQPPRRRTWRIVALFTLAALLLVGIYLAFFRGRHADSTGGPPPDPRLAYTGPYRNIDPAVQYVADERCGDCHQKEAHSFAEHPMGRSLFPIATAHAPPTGPQQNNPFEALGSRFQVERVGDHVWHRRVKAGPDGRPIAESAWEVRFVIGSGTRGFSYLSDRDGYLSETPISWYSQKNLWDLSPGFGPAQAIGRAVIPDCLFCHANRARHIEGTSNQYAEPIFAGYAIGCQRCHGPGERHVAARQAGTVTATPDYTIVNPRHLEPALRDAVCEQCHLQGKLRFPGRGRAVDDFRPGLPMELFWSVFNRVAEPGESQKAVGQVEQMEQSHCFAAGSDTERLSCISCHDPHVRVLPAQRVRPLPGELPEVPRATRLQCSVTGAPAPLRRG